MVADVAVVQLNTQLCQLYTSCLDCVRDPHCGWSSGLRRSGRCQQYQSGYDDYNTSVMSLSVCLSVSTACMIDYTVAVTVTSNGTVSCIGLGVSTLAEYIMNVCIHLHINVTNLLPEPLLEEPSPPTESPTLLSI